MRFFFLLWAVGFPSFIPAADYDVVIRGGKILDGTGAKAREGDLAILDGRIAAIGEVPGRGREEIQALGKVVAPGFIDVHTHSEDLADTPSAENFLRMGVTTIVTGNCGMSQTDVGQFFKSLDAKKVAVNVGVLIGHGTVREACMGGKFLRPPKESELQEMCQTVERAMQAGALGMSTGLIYVPGSFAKTEEIIRLAEIVAKHDGFYASHVRHETVRIWDAMEEFLSIVERAKVRGQWSHLKLSGPSAWGQAEKVLKKLDKARQRGLQITHDVYAYTASSTGLRQAIPDSALEGGRSAFQDRLKQPEEKKRILEGMQAILARSGRQDYSYAVIARYSSDPSLQGLNIPEACQKVRGKSTVDEQMELLLEIESRGGGSGVFHGMNEEDLRVFLKHPFTFVASDGGPRQLGVDVPHPRSYGNNARVIEEYVERLHLLTLEDAVKKMTSLPAALLKLKDRGVLKVGAAGDVVIFSPSEVRAPSTFKDPHHYAEGFSHVWVNGTAVIQNGKRLQKFPGKMLRHIP